MLHHSWVYGVMGDKQSGSCSQNYRFYGTNPISCPDFNVFSIWSDRGGLGFVFKMIQFMVQPQKASVQMDPRSASFSWTSVPLNFSVCKCSCQIGALKKGGTCGLLRVCSCSCRVERLCLWGVEKGYSVRCWICIRISVSLQESTTWNKMSPHPHLLPRANWPLCVLQFDGCWAT